MSCCLQHRGPDQSAYFINENETVGFAHHRLAIIDKSALANQPFHYLDYTIIFNGEIYNYLELKQELSQSGYSFTTSSDTEVVVAAYDKWGDACLSLMDGMFAFLIYNKREDRVFAARDRFGEKPFYYHVDYKERGRLHYMVFASEMKSLWSYGLPKQVNGMMMLNYLSLGYVQNPLKKSQTFFSNILSLPPGHLLNINVREGKIRMTRWYRTNRTSETQTLSEEEAIDKFSSLFIQSVDCRLRSDVSVGTSLSGGLDSSAVVASISGLRKTSAWSNLCFSAVFPGFASDENNYSKKVADAFGLTRYTITPTADDLAQHFKKFMMHQEEPVQSSSVFTQYMVYRKAKEKGITVLLDGQGADEIMGGYRRYMHWYLQQLLAGGQLQLFRREKQLLQQNDLLEQWGFANYIAAFNPAKTAALLQKRAINQQRKNQFINKEFLVNHTNTDSLQKPVIKKLEDLLYYNTFIFGLEELLRYADRNSMAHSTEVRLPFLNHELVTFIFSLPSNFKVRDGFTKWILRKSVENHLPPDITWRKGKVGYEPPQAEWLRHPAVIELIKDSRQKLVQLGVLNSSILSAPIAAHAAHEAGNLDWRILCAAAIM